MSDGKWAKMPCYWQTSQVMHAFIAAAPPGEAIAALKLYVVMCIKANYAPKPSLPATGCVKRSLVQLGRLTGLSKPMVVAGLRRLRTWELINDFGGRPATYGIAEYETASYWTKLPKTHLYNGLPSGQVKLITSLPNRGKPIVQALQMYLYIASIRDKSSLKATVTYERLTEVLGFSRNAVSRSISYLAGADLMSARQGEIDEFRATEHLCNVYWLRGSVSDEDRQDAMYRESAGNYPINM